MKLVIAEKPSVAKTIANVIGATKHNDGTYQETAMPFLGASVI